MNGRRVSIRRVVVICALGLLMAATGAAAAERPSSSRPADRPALPGEPVCEATSTRLPENVRIDPFLMPRIKEMLRRSASFRQQCRRLAAAPWAHVGVKLNPQLFEAQSYRALSFIQRPQPKLIVARVTLQALSDPALWLAHELEHVLEQVDDVDVQEMAETKRGAWRVGHHMFETRRAIVAGETVASEVRSGHSQPMDAGDPDEHNFVE